MHKGDSYPGEHDAIIDRAVWDKVHAILTESPRKRAARTRADTPALLKGLLYGPDGAAFSPTHTRKGGKLYRYYVSQTVLKHGAGSCPVGRVPAGEIEAAVIDQLRTVFRQRALADVGLDGEEAALDIRDLRSLLDCVRLVRRTAMQTAVRMITTGVMLALLAGIAIKLKIFGGGP